MSDAELGLSAFPLVDHYFGDHLRKLMEVRQTDVEYEGYFVGHAFYSEALEARLGKVEGLGLTQAIVDEVGDTDDAQELDRRLMDAWAELRTLDQLQREGLSDIQKVRDIADFTATCGELRYAIQATHINRTLPEQVSRRNPKGKRDASPYGLPDDVYQRLPEPLFYLFWDSIQRKNSNFSNWPQEGWLRCVVLVTNEPSLQVQLTRYIACQQLRACVHDLQKRHFEELYWLLDDGNGARFIVGDSPDLTRCLADWKDEFPGPESDFLPIDVNDVSRQEVDLDFWHPSGPQGSGRRHFPDTAGKEHGQSSA